MVIPVICLILLRILVYPVSEGINVTGALIYFTIPMPIQDFPVTESQVNSLAVLIMLCGLCLYLTHGIRKNVSVKRTVLAEWIVEKVEGLVKDNMGEFFSTFGPFIAAVMGLSGFSSLLALFGLYAPTSDINIVGGWAILVFFLITYYKAICGPVQYLKSFTEPVALLTPINLISEIATPISMAFRHYGNVLSGSVISVLLAAGLQGLSAMVLGWLPGFLGDIPLFRVGIPAVLSIYFDIFSGCLQAFIFATLTMMYVSSGFPQDEYEKRRLKKAQKAK
ncbi:MAG: F0F1 ATP synthase subunit A [Ruminococcaceae bacterium]|nr:F0F1 ATP synthase subunit A [Oscillospiraceae bacterium]